MRMREPEIITERQPCAGCGYDLRFQPRSGSCPECGLPVARTLSPSPSRAEEEAKLFAIGLMVPIGLLVIVGMILSVAALIGVGGAPAIAVVLVFLALGVIVAAALGRASGYVPEICTCGYSPRGLPSDRCPECGRLIAGAGRPPRAEMGRASADSRGEDRL